MTQASCWIGSRARRRREGEGPEQEDALDAANASRARALHAKARDHRVHWCTQCHTAGQTMSGGLSFLGRLQLRW